MQYPLLPRGALESFPPRPHGANQHTCQWFSLRAAAVALKQCKDLLIKDTLWPHGPLWLKLSATVTPLKGRSAVLLG